jgi:hypothetical protein
MFSADFWRFVTHLKLGFDIELPRPECDNGQKPLISTGFMGK